MTLSDILKQLQRVYSAENLNFLSSALIEAYRLKNDAFFHTLSMALNEKHPKHKQFFTEMIMMVHPDRRTYHTRRIQELGRTEETGKLAQYIRILTLDRFIKTQTPASSNAEPGVRAARPGKAPAGTGTAVRRGSGIEPLHDFLSALKQKEYGNLDVVYHRIDLENTEGDLELSGRGISDLSGLEYCVNLTGLDLSDNFIYDIQALSGLVLLEEIDLSENRISRLEALTEMHALRQLDISFNEVEDLSPLLDLERLETINCIGNPVPDSQVQILRKQGVLVISS